MRTMKLLPLLAALASGAALAQPAAETGYPDLPPTQVVAQTLRGNPSVLAAQASVQTSEANRSALQAGPYEYNVRLGSQRRTVRTDPSQRFGEWNVGLEKTFRLPGKVSLDADLGDQGVEQAKLAYGDALHEAGRTLLKLWFGWVRENRQAVQWQAQVDVLSQELAAVEKRVKAGDAPRMEALLAKSTLAQSQAELQQARLRERMAATELRRRFPGIDLPADPTLVPPVPLEHDLDYWKQQVLEHNHELGLARAETRKWQLLASRAQADRMPDPAVGVHYGSERGGEERIVGVTLSIPLPGQARAANQLGMQAQATAAAQREAAVLARLETEVANQYAAAMSSFESWQQTRDAAAGLQQSADLMGRAYSLGEASLTEVLTARRQALESNLNATLAQVDAAENRYRLLLDAHQLWPLDADEEGGVHAHY